MPEAPGRSAILSTPLALSFVLVLVSGAMSVRAANRDIRFERISTEQGLSQSSVLCMLQDSRGLMWFGTFDGLNRYDGYTFTIYKPDPDSPRSLSSNDITSLYEDRLGVLWIGTVHGLNSFDTETESFTRYMNDPGNPSSLSRNFVTSILEDKSGALWVGTNGGGLNRFNRKTGAFTRYTNDPHDSWSLSHNGIRSLHEDRSGLLWIGTAGGGLDALDAERKTFTHYKEDPTDHNSLSSNDVGPVYQDRSGMLWVGTAGEGLDALDPRTGIFTHYKSDSKDRRSLSNDYIQSIHRDQSGALWVGTADGLNRLDGDNGTFERYKHDPGSTTSLSGNRIRSLFQDRSGVLWIGTLDGGLSKLNPRQDLFARWAHEPGNPNSVSGNAITSLLEDQFGVLWVGTRSGGLNRFDRERGVFTHYENEPGNRTSLSHNRVSAIYEDRAGTLWIGTFAGLNRLERQGSIFTRFQSQPGNPDGLSNDRVRAILEDRAGSLWIGTGNGLDKFDRDRGTFQHYKNDPANPNSLSDNEILTIHEDRTGTLWVGTGGGLNQFDPETQKFVRHESRPGDLTSLSNNRVRVIHEDQSGVLWLGTSGGLNELVPPGPQSRAGEGARFRYYTEKDGLPNDVIYGILEDRHGNLWLSTNRGLSRFNPGADREGGFRNYDVKDGLQSNEFNSGAYHKSPSGEMFFGGINGFNSFHPEEVMDNLHIPPIFVTDFRIFGQSVSSRKSVRETDEIVLSYEENVFSFEFAAVDFTDPAKNQHSYKMEGFDEDWIHSGERRFATYTNLDPGEYVFRVKGSNSDGVWNESGASVKLTITPPFWQTGWFRALAGLCALGLTATVYRGRVRRFERAAKVLEERVREGTAELAEKNQYLEEEIQQREEAERAIQYRIGIEILIATLSNNFINLSAQNADRGIDKALEMIGSFDQVDRSYVFLLSEDGESFSNTHEWCDRGIAPTIEQYQDLPCARFPWLTSRLRDLEIIHLRHLDDLPPEEETLRTYLEDDGLQSLINVPMAAEGKFIGFLGFDSLKEPKVWSKEDIRLLKMVGEMFVSALERKKADAELRSAHAQLVQSEKTAALGQLTAGILHEINTPVGVLKANADLALRCISRLKEAPKEHREKALRVLEDASLTNASASDRIEHILNHLKKFIRLDESRFALVDIHQGIDSTLALLGADLRAGISIRRAYGDVPRIPCYPAELNQVFMTILENAMDAIDGEGCITIQTSTIGDELVIRFADSGRGMTDEKLGCLFDMGFSTDGTRVGIGMGLAHAYNVVQRHCGTMAATSRPGQGTEIVIKLPLEERNGNRHRETVSA